MLVFSVYVDISVVNLVNNKVTAKQKSINNCVCGTATVVCVLGMTDLLVFFDFKLPSGLTVIK